MGVVLAGGMSTRMKRDKALLRLKNKTLLEFQVEKLQEMAEVKRICVSGQRDGYDCIPDLEVGLGPVEAVRSVLFSRKHSEISWDGFLFLPVDMPLVSSPSLKELILNFDDSDAVKFANTEMPLLLRNSEKVRETLESLRGSRGSSAYSVKRFLAECEVKQLQTSSPFEFVNTNTPEEWDGAISSTNAIDANFN